LLNKERINHAPEPVTFLDQRILFFETIGRTSLPSLIGWSQQDMPTLWTKTRFAVNQISGISGTSGQRAGLFTARNPAVDASF